MRRTLALRRDALADLTPADLAGVAGGQPDSIPCLSRCEVVAVLEKWLQDRTVLCPISAGCPPTP